MGWVKNIWKRMFPEDLEEESKEADWEQAPPQQKGPTPFRFPLIPDDEKEVFIRRDATLVKIEPSMKKEKLPSLEMQTPEPAVSPVRKPIAPPSNKTVPPKSRPQTSAPKPLNKTRRFEPTKVPSPVYGFDESRPAPIENLLERKEIHFEPKKLPEPMAHRQTVQQTKEPSGKSIVSQPILDENLISGANAGQTPVYREAPPAIQEQAPVLEEAPILLQEPVIEEAPVSRTETFVEEEKESVQEPAVEEEPVLVQEFADQETVTIPQEPVKEENEQAVHITAQKLQPEIEKAESVQEKKREKTVPFNVLMLKSDKQRLMKNGSSAANKPVEPKREEAVATELKIEKTSKPAEAIAVETKPAKESLPAEKESPIEIAEEKPSAYLHPESDFLLAPEDDRKDESWMEEQGERLVEALSHFQIQASILSIVQGPAVTQFELTVAQGVKVSKIRNLADDLKLALAAKDIRIQAPIPGKSSIGIEIPNRTSRAVRISEIIDSPVFRESDSPLEAALGLDLTGKPVTLDLRKMPHGLIAGATGSGKSVCINSLLVSLLYKSSPKDLKLLLIDPKMVELAPYNHIPHLVSPVITDVKAATASLKWAVEEMERRYQLFAHVGVRDISRYNKTVKEKGDHAQHLPYILIIIDELADLMMMSPSDVEDAICRIAQKARACGIHLVIATQRPSVDVITGLIKSNIPTRIAFSVSSQVDSRTILDSQGAERLLGRGDMLYLGNGMSAPVRLQGTFVTDEEIETIIEHVRAQGKPEYFFKEEELMKRTTSPGEQDDLFEEACRFILAQGTASTSLLQRKFHIGYNRAARLMDLLEEQGFISEQNGSKARSVLITADDMAEVFQ
ncbi:S-DNA-T family DNA segregation ATPase FtsK/SpoIIIE [Planomicrobium soli]|uniref:S-DNA-T family DNA segregation ATPase FtsK/SpoIIIE n=1 Tax=Planomicrobium soli TaxID=1176648 RepID=A0A2P8GAU6_9BACL|nr:DNA translocase FtsK [Planomicrobium soli]PSL31092.1 S-DNA-T family DNA segregation ATPase FtsK/SpoIIIE [Planomicrobium soli]